MTKKHPSINYTQPSQLNVMNHLNYCKTQRLDLRDINQQILNQQENRKQNSGSTRNQNNQNFNFLALNHNSSKNSNLNIVNLKECKVKSAKSAGSA